MAGGSTDAAMTLIGLNILLGLGLTPDRLCSIGAGLGADIPYCLMADLAVMNGTGSTTLRCSGIGEVLTPLPRLSRCHLLIAKPAFDISARWSYTAFDSMTPDLPVLDPDTTPLSPRITDLARAIFNVLEPVALSAHPVIADIRHAMLDSGAALSRMTGSGPTVFGMFESSEASESARTALAERFGDPHSEGVPSLLQTLTTGYLLGG